MRQKPNRWKIKNGAPPKQVWVITLQTNMKSQTIMD